MAVKALPLIVDTDLSSDVDDAADLKAAALLHNLGLVELLGVNVTTSFNYGPGAADAILAYMGLSDRTAIPIGALKNATLDPLSDCNGTGPYQYVYNNFPRSVGLASTVQDAVTNYRTLLAARSEADVTIVALGFSRALHQLLLSPADGISGLTGAQLVAAKVQRLVYVAGWFPTSGNTVDFNLSQDPASGAYLAANWPTPLEWFGEENGQGVLCGTSIQTALTSADPVREIYRIAGVPAQGRPAWGTAVFHYLLNRHMYRLIQGTNAVNSSTGVNTFTTGGTGTQFYVSRLIDNETMLRLLEAAIYATPPANLAGFTGPTV